MYASGQRTNHRQRLGEILKCRLGAGNWVPIVLSDLESLSLRQAAVLAIIVNLSKGRADNDGWILLTERYLADGPLALSADQQEKALSALEEMHLLTVRGEGGSRHVRVNLEALEKLAPSR